MSALHSILPRGVERQSVAEHECLVVLFEPVATLNTRDVQTEKAKAELERI